MLFYESSSNLFVINLFWISRASAFSSVVGVFDFLLKFRLSYSLLKLPLYYGEEARTSSRASMSSLFLYALTIRDFYSSKVCIMSIGCSSWRPYRSTISYCLDPGIEEELTWAEVTLSVLIGSVLSKLSLDTSSTSIFKGIFWMLTIYCYFFGLLLFKFL